MGESGLVHSDNGDLSDDVRPLIERLTAPLPHLAAGGDGQQRLSRVHLGGNMHGSELIVPDGQTWAVQGDVRIGDGAVLKIEDGATLQVQGHPEPPVDRVRLRIPADFDATAARQQLEQSLGNRSIFSAELQRQAALPDLFSAELQRQAALPDLSALVSAEWAITPPFEALQEYQAALAESARAALEPAMLGIANVGLWAAAEQVESVREMMRQALNPPTLGAMESIREMMRQQDDAVKAALSSGRMMGSALGALDMGRHALTDLDTVRNALSMGGSGLGLLDDVNRTLRRGGYSLGLLDDVNQALSRRDQRRRVREQHQATTDQQVQVVSLPTAGDWREALTHALTSGQASPADVGAFLHGFSTERRRAGLFPPDWQLIEMAVAIYKKDGHKHTYETFVINLARKGIEISVATFRRWLELYENHTGEQVRPGKGRKRYKQL